MEDKDGNEIHRGSKEYPIFGMMEISENESSTLTDIVMDIDEDGNIKRMNICYRRPEDSENKWYDYGVLDQEDSAKMKQAINEVLKGIPIYKKR